MQGVVNVLIVEDSPDDAILVERELRRLTARAVTTRVENEVAMRAFLAAQTIDLVISDWSLPQFSGARALEVAREIVPDVPFIIVSGDVGEEVAVAAMRAGTSDYVLKDKLRRLVPAIERELREAKERVERRAAEEQLRRERTTAEAALRASESRFARLAETGVLGVAVVALDGAVQDANEMFARLTGYERHELLAPTFRWIALVPPEHHATAQEVVTQLRSQGALDPIEREVVRKDGTRVWTLLGGALLDDMKGIMFLVDLSAQKRAEAALALSEQQLRHAQKMEAMGRLAGGVAHDFNNVLSVILSYAEMVIEDVKPGHVRDDLIEIRKAAERAAELTEQLLVFSRKHAVVSTLVEPAQVVHDLERMLRRLIGEDVALEIAQADEIPTIRIDKGQLDQVLINLAINARDAMPKGGKLTISLSSARLDQKFAATHHGVTPGRYARIVVTDTGTGIDSATIGRIFEPFFTTKDVGKGTGLGLSTVFGIIQRAGGTIWVSSEVDVGTSFTMYLPHSEDASMPISTVPPPGDLRGTETILIAEDDAQVRMVAEHILTRAGYQVLSARSGVDAIRIANEHPGPIDLLISDVVMPQLSGVELAHRISLSRPGIAVLHISGYTDDVTVHHGALSEAQFLQKPLTPESLRAKVRQALATRGIARSA